MTDTKSAMQPKYKTITGTVEDMLLTGLPGGRYRSRI